MVVLRINFERKVEINFYGLVDEFERYLTTLNFFNFFRFKDLVAD